MKIKNIIWDFDGTIMDTYPAIATSAYNVAKKYDVDISYNDIYNMTKITLREALEYISSKTALSYDKLFQDYLNEYDKYDISSLIIFPHLVDVLKAVINNAGKNFIITHRGKNSLVQHLQDKNISNFFAYLISGDCNFPRKPQPHAFIFLKDKFNLSSKDTIVVGDRLLDVEAGYEAGFSGILYNNSQDFSGKIASIKDYQQLFEMLDTEL